MIGTLGNAGTFGLQPVSPELFVDPAQSFRCLHKCKTDPHMAGTHITDVFPGNCLLVFADVYSMNGILVRQVDSKLTVMDKCSFMIQPADEIGDTRHESQGYHDEGYAM